MDTGYDLAQALIAKMVGMHPSLSLEFSTEIHNCGISAGFGLASWKATQEHQIVGV